MHVYACTCHDVWIWRPEDNFGEFFPSSMWLLGIKLRSPGLEASLLTDTSQHKPRVSWCNQLHSTSTNSFWVGHGAHSSNRGSQRPRQEDGKFKASLGYIFRPCLKIKPNPTKPKLHFKVFILIINSGKIYQWMLKFVEESLKNWIVTLQWSCYKTWVNHKDKQEFCKWRNLEDVTTYQVTQLVSAVKGHTHCMPLIKGEEE